MNVLIHYSVFLAIKHASAAMEKTCEPKGKTEGGGSVLVTASGDYLLLIYKILFNYLLF